MAKGTRGKILELRLTYKVTVRNTGEESDSTFG